MKLNALTTGQGQPLVIIHGLFGASANFRSLGNILSQDFEVHALDLRNHGDSPHAPQHDYASMTADVMEYIDEHQLDNIILAGHSMGGKVAMNCALNYQAPFAGLLVVDMAPRPYEASSEHLHILAALAKIPLESLESRQQADEILAAERIVKPIRQFLLTNLVSGDNGWRWRINLPVLQSEYGNIREAITGPAFDKPTTFLRGGRSNYVKDEDWDLISSLFPQATLETVTEAGHWVHAEAPQAFISEVRKLAAR